MTGLSERKSCRVGQGQSERNTAEFGVKCNTLARIRPHGMLSDALSARRNRTFPVLPLLLPLPLKPSGLGVVELEASYDDDVDDDVVSETDVDG